MAEGAQAVPTFKLVLVGDGGTGKVSVIPIAGCDAACIHGWNIVTFIPAVAHVLFQLSN